MKSILNICLLILSFSCKKPRSSNQTSITNSGYRIENFRKPGMDDYQTIKAACDSLPENSKIVFDNKTYVISHTPIIEKSFEFYGPATFKRENQITYTLKEAATEFSTYLILNSTAGLIDLDRIEICINSDISGATPINAILHINGDTIFLANAVGKAVNGSNYYDNNTKIFKSIIFFWILSSTKYTDISCSFSDFIFDGNKDNNTGTHYWNINSAITAITKGTTTYGNCSFINSPNETIVGHNADISNCTFYNLNGSGFHASADKQNCTEVEIHSYLSNNLFENTNQVPNSITGHSEGAITHSNSGGYYTAINNSFINVGESVLGSLEPGATINDWGTSSITFTNNIIHGAGRMVFQIDTTYPGVIHDVRIEKNTISNMPSEDWSKQLNHFPGIILKDKNGE